MDTEAKKTLRVTDCHTTCYRLSQKTRSSRYRLSQKNSLRVTDCHIKKIIYEEQGKRRGSIPLLLTKFKTKGVINMDLMQGVFKNYDISSLKIFYTILKFMKMDQLIVDENSKTHPKGFYHCEMHIRDIAKAINYKARHIERLEKLGKKVSEVFHNGVGTKSDELDEFGNTEYETIHPIYKHKYKDGVFSVDIPVSVFEELNSIFMTEKLDELLKLDDKISFRLYQMLFSNISRGKYIIHLNHFNTVMGTAYETRVLSSKIKESIKEINEKTDILIDIEKIEPVFITEDSRKILVDLKLNYSRKIEEHKFDSIKGILQATIEKTCLNRFFEAKYKKNVALHNSVINKLVDTYSEEIVIKALNSLRKELKVDIEKSLQAYLTKCCNTEAENVRLAQEIKDKKQEKINAEVANKQQELATTNETKNNDAELMSQYQNMPAEERDEVVKAAEQYYLQESDATEFNPITRPIFEKHKRVYIIQIMKKRGA